MGLIVSHITGLESYKDRQLYVYLLDFGWPDGEYEQIFKRHWHALSGRASDNKSLIISSNKGIHFANEVLSYHRVFELDADEVLPAILITKTHPSYFVETNGPMEREIENSATDELCKDDVVLIPLKLACSTPDAFASVIESIFSDLEGGLELQNFSVAKHDANPNNIPPAGSWRRVVQRVGKSILLAPNVAGIGVDLKELIKTDSK